MENLQGSNNASSQINEDSLVEEVRLELQEIDAMELNDHAQRFEVLHQQLNKALSSIDGL
jgi:hypothetical protein